MDARMKSETFRAMDRLEDQLLEVRSMVNQLASAIDSLYWYYHDETASRIYELIEQLESSEEGL